MGIAQELGYPCVLIQNEKDETQGVNSASWVIVTRNFDFLADAEVVKEAEPCWPEQGEPLVWTDDYGSLWQVLTKD
jgi:hypothetical protein